MELKGRIKAARKHAGLTQEELGRAVGVSQTTILDLERARSQSSKHLFSIARICGVSAAWLIDNQGKMLPEEGGNYVREDGKEYKANKAAVAAKSLADTIVRHALAGLLTEQDIEALNATESALSKKHQRG